MHGTAAHLGQRRARRANVYYIARLATLHEEYPVKLLDVSPFGARVQTELDLVVGDAVQLIRAELRLFSRVVWIRENHVGLEFDEPAGDQQAIRALAIPSSL